MNFHYAQIDENGDVVGVSALWSEVTSQNLIPVAASFDYTGKRWDGGKWIDIPAAENPAALRPVLQIDDVQTSDPDTEYDPGELTVTAGAQVSVTVSLRHPVSRAVLPVTKRYRMPIKSRDGRERVLAASFEHGQATITGTFNDSGVWQVSEAIINADLDPGEHMSFPDGLSIFVLEA